MTIGSLESLPNFASNNTIKNFRRKIDFNLFNDITLLSLTGIWVSCYIIIGLVMLQVQFLE